MKRLLVVFLLAFCSSACASQPLPQPPLSEIELNIAGHALIAEVAVNDSQRTQGLMYRRMLPEDHGMLFVFAEPSLVGIWMKNTLLPLSVAFIDAEGVIINIADMKPLTTNVHRAEKPALFALETPQGWFARHGIKPGTRIKNLKRAPPAQ
jgi:uncharacterized membrane protein (UPF0127 family)